MIKRGRERNACSQNEERTVSIICLAFPGNPLCWNQAFLYLLLFWDRSLAWRGKNKSMLIAIHVMGQNSAYRHNLGINWEHRTDYDKIGGKF